MNSIFVWTLSDVLYMAIGGLLVLVWVLISLRTWWRQSRCKHEGGVRETQACNAICLKCGKNLGFIGSWRNRNKSKPGDVQSNN